MRFTLLVAALHGLSVPAAAQAKDRWTTDQIEARALLPSPRGATQVQGAALSCAAQRWQLDIVMGEETPAGDASLKIDGHDFLLSPVAEAEGLVFAVPQAAIEPLKAGWRLEFVLADETTTFSLRASSVAITAGQERCTQRDMSAYRPVTFTPFSSYINLGRELRQDDLAAFRASTASEAKLDVAMVEFGEGRRLLLTRLCGSSWYYGASGCNIAGFAPAGDEDWKPVYDTENVLLYSDPDNVTDGWPDLVTLPASQKGRMVAGPGLIWRWDGNAYALKGELPDDEPEETGENQTDAQDIGE